MSFCSIEKKRIVNSVNFSSSHFGQSYIIHVTIELEVEMKILIFFLEQEMLKCVV